MPKLLLSAAFIFTASLASAMCTHGQKHAMSCGEGSSYDSATQACVPIVSS